MLLTRNPLDRLLPSPVEFLGLDPVPPPIVGRDRFVHCNAVGQFQDWVTTTPGNPGTRGVTVERVYETQDKARERVHAGRDNDRGLNHRVTGSDFDPQLPESARHIAAKCLRQ